MVGVAETAGIVVVTMAIIHGLLKLVDHLLETKRNEKRAELDERLIEALTKAEEKLDASENCGLTEGQAQELRELHAWHSRVDGDGTPLWYVPRSWAETQKEIADKLQSMTNINYKMLNIIERLERRLERLDSKD
jgi:chromosome segregation ATPase